MACAVLTPVGVSALADTTDQNDANPVSAASSATDESVSDVSGCSGADLLAPGYRWCFTDPKYGTGTEIEDHLVSMASKAGSGDTIRISIFNWDRPKLANAVMDAADDGADVEVIFDEFGANCSGGSGSGCSGGSGSGSTQASEPDDNPVYRDLVNHADVDVTTCTDGCLGGNINHNKLFLFEIDGMASAAVSSSNLVDTQIAKPNSLLQVNGDWGLYNYLTDYFARTAEGSWGGWTTDTHRKYSGFAADAFVYPRDTDNFEATLSDIGDCADNGSSRVWVTPFTFREPRKAVLDQLVRLQDMGCDVRVMVDIKTSNEPDLDWMTDGGLDRGNIVRSNTHNKFVAVDAHYRDEWREFVLTGSHNLNRPSMKANDESVLQVTDPEVTQAHMDYFEALFDRGE